MVLCITDKMDKMSVFQLKEDLPLQHQIFLLNSFSFDNIESVSVCEDNGLIKVKFDSQGKSLHTFTN